MALRPHAVLRISPLSLSHPLSAPARRTFRTGPPVQHATPTRPLRSGVALPAGMSLPSPLSSPDTPPPQHPGKAAAAAAAAPPAGALSVLPLAPLLRNLAMAEITRRPWLFDPALRLLSAVAYSQSPLLSPRRNPLVRWALKPTLYAHFCAGETPAEVAATVARLRAWGIEGVLLGWAREVEERGEAPHPDGAAAAAAAYDAPRRETAADTAEIDAWLAGIRATLGLTRAGDVACVKLTGAGALNLANLRRAAPPSPTLAAGLEALCTTALARGVTFEIDAEQVAVQPGIEAWSLALQRRYNGSRATVVATYQAYLRATPARLAADLGRAAREGFVLGVKLVRGAYLASDPRDAIWATKAGTDRAYDGLAAAIIARRWDPAALPGAGAFPPVRLVLATHNGESARSALAAQRRGAEVVHAQLMGMADHVSCELVARRRQGALGVRPFKYLVWGRLDECLKYLVRRAEENRDAATRSEEGRAAMWAEVRRRARAPRE